MAAIIEVNDLSFAYRQTPILFHVTFTVQEGEFIGIIGPNGGGKTTLLKLLMGFLNPNQGTIRLFGEAPDAARLDIGYVPQSLRFDRQFPITVLEVVLMGRMSHLPWYGRYTVHDKKLAQEALEQVGIVHLKDKSFGTLSGGEMQRALIARALASQPRLLLLDEPTASVDNQAETEIYQLLQQLRGKMTILMVTHDLHTAVALVDRVLCVQRQALSLSPQNVCEHFAYGLYHKPISLGESPISSPFPSTFNQEKQP